ncbi:MAG: histidine phosphatase family protein [Solirubrobacteraceae bacterium]
MALFILVRHAQSTLNLVGRVNGDPAVPVELTQEGVEQAHRLGLQLAQLPIDLCVHTRFVRTRRTAAIALEGRGVPFREEPLLDDIKLGELEGETTADYRAWKQEHTRRDRFPGGESLEMAALRYARALARLASTGAEVVLVVCHEIPLRYAINGAAGSATLEAPIHDVPNATPFLFAGSAIERAAQAIERLAGR